MKNLFLIGFTLVSMSSFAQLNFGLKAGAVFNADKGVVNTLNGVYADKGKGSVGFQAGAMARANLAGFYVQPELLYTSFKNEYDDANGDAFEIGKRRLDIPVNFGKTFAVGLVHVQTGPVFSFYFEDDISVSDVQNAERDEFNMGWQIGTGVNVKSFVFDVRYEFGFGKVASGFIHDGLGYQTENRSKLLNISVGYFF